MKFLVDRCARRPGDDPIFALNREATERRAAGASIVNATVGAILEDDGTLAILPSFVEALRAVAPVRSAAYAPIGGHPELLAAVVADLLAGSPLAAQAVAVATPGGTGALRHAVSTFLERGQALLTTSFYWGPYLTICDEHERALRTFPMFDDHGGFHVAALERALAELATSQGRLLVFLNDPCHNPTGYSMTDGEWAETAAVLAAAATRVPLVVLADIAYLDYAHDRDRRFLDRLAPLAERALVLLAWSASKSFTAYGQRVGVLVACTALAAERDAVRSALTFASRATWSSCHTAGQLAVARCLTEAPLAARIEAERERLRLLLHARVRAFNQAAQRARLAFPRNDGGFFVTVFTDDAHAAAARMRAEGLFVVPQPGALRIALSGVAESEVVRLVDGIAAAFAVA